MRIGAGLLLLPLVACGHVQGDGLVQELGLETGPAGLEIEAEEVVPGVHLFRGEFIEGRQPDGNSVMIEAPEGFVIVDTGRHEAHTRRLLSFAENMGKPIVAVVNTHWHLDHVGGNVLLRSELPALEVHASAAIHEALEGFLANYRSQIEEYIPSIGDAEEALRMKRELALIESGRQLVPNQIVKRSGPVEVAGAELHLQLESHAVTSGDVWILLPATGVVIAGDLVTLPVPLFDTACPGRWLESLDRMAREEFTVVIPGHGQPLDREELDEYRTAFRNLLECAAGDASDETCADEWIEDAEHLIPAAERPFALRLLNYYIPTHLRTWSRDLCGEV